jgi:Protein of unknown function (DUF1566)
LDKETGLVWEQAPEAIIPPVRTWTNAIAYCLDKPVGGTRGWRLPSVVELASLINPSLPAPFVPASAFTIGDSPGVQSAFYWSATSIADFPTNARGVSFNGNGLAGIADKYAVGAHVWCVRGPMQESVY